jgi:hypothetical protein
VGTRREKTDIGQKEKKEGAECVMRRERQSNTCGMDVAKLERGRKRNREKYWMKTEGMDERDMEEGKDREGEGWEILKFKGYFWNCYFRFS